MGVLKKYVDVSKYQGNINFARLAKAVDGVIIRAGYGKGVIDPYFHRNAEGCEKYGIPFGVYWFSYALNVPDAKAEAQACLSAIKGMQLELPICFDFEYDSVRYAESNGVKIMKTRASEIAAAFLEEIENAGYFALNYANEDYCKNYFDTSIMKKYGLWYARYLDNPDFDTRPRNCLIWQYSSTGKVDGINGNVDVNVGYGDLTKIIRESGRNHLKTKEETNVKKWYAAAMEWAKAEGITDGSKPDEPATRAQVWAMLHRMAKKGE